jgi:D-cysteine desulfhydrase
VNAALELVAQVQGILVPRPEAVVVPFGSGGTAAGLLVGMWLAGAPIDVCAVRVTDPWFATRRRILGLARDTMTLLAAAGAKVSPGAARLYLVRDQLGPGYGHSTPKAVMAQALFAEAGISVDLTYGAKASAALATLAGSFRHLCFWNTFDPRLTAPPEHEHPLLRRAREQAEKLWPHPK